MRKELCRNFQRGSCQYGARCKFLHSAQQQSKPNPFGFGAQSIPQQQQQQPKLNPFGFGAQTIPQQQQQQPKSNPFGFGVQAVPQQQQQEPNPFGFGVQSSSQPARFGKSYQSKPFENKWSRFSPILSGGASVQHTGNQSQQGEQHKCTDPDACKRIIQEDFKNERPLWKLTCYGHWKYMPCDIGGDISYEELRIAAYDEAKQGLSLQSIIERERNLLNSKLAEYENFLRSPYKSSGSPALPSQTKGFGTPPSTFPPTGQISNPPVFPGFAQQVPSTNTGFGVRPALSPPSSLGPPSSFAGFSQPSNAFGTSIPQPVPSGPSGFQFHTPTPGSPFTAKPAAFGNADTPKTDQFSTSIAPKPVPNLSQNQTPFNLNFPVASSDAPAQDNTNGSSRTDLQREADSVDTSIWLKERWKPGEIPEQPPPDAFV